MRNLIIILLSLCSGWGYSQSFWDSEKIETTFDLIRAGKANEAQEKVMSWGNTPYDFGLDLLSQGRGQQALDWFEAMISISDTKTVGVFHIGLAWSYRALGEPELAELEIHSVFRSTDLLTKARGYYLLGLLELDKGQTEYGLSLIQESQDLYRYLDKSGGVMLCQDVIFKIQNSTLLFSKEGDVVTGGYDGAPPRDDRDS